MSKHFSKLSFILSSLVCKVSGEKFGKEGIYARLIHRPITDDFVHRPTEANENLPQVLESATNCSTVQGDYKVSHEDKHSLCGFHSVVSSEQPERRAKMVYILARDGKMGLHHCHEIVPD